MFLLSLGFLLPSLDHAQIFVWRSISVQNSAEIQKLQRAGAAGLRLPTVTLGTDQPLPAPMRAAT